MKKELIAESFRKTFTRRTPDSENLAKVIEALKLSDRGLSEDQRNELDDAMDLDLQDSLVEAAGQQDWLEKLICNVKIYKSPGPDGIPNEFYYLLRKNEHLISLLKNCFKY